jgi:hypothetical protein
MHLHLAVLAGATTNLRETHLYVDAKRPRSGLAGVIPLSGGSDLAASGLTLRRTGVVPDDSRGPGIAPADQSDDSRPPPDHSRYAIVISR